MTDYSIQSLTPENRHLWDEFVVTQDRASPYHLSAWLFATQAAYKMKQIGLMALDKHQHVCAIAPNINVKGLFGTNTLCALPYCDRGEILAENYAAQEFLEKALLQQADLLSVKQWEYRQLDFTFSENNTDLQGKKVAMLLPLPESADTLLASFKSKLRSQIKKAEKNGLTFKIGTDQQALMNFYQVYTTNMRDLGSPCHSLAWFEQVVEQYQDNCVISVVYMDEIPVGAGLVLKCGDKASIPWASTVQAYNRLAPNMLLYWSLLGHCADNHIREFDFGRSTYEEGTYKFKKQWGAKPIPLLWQDKLHPTAKETVPASDSAMKQLLVKGWQKLPLPFSVFLGSKLRRYITL